MHAKHRNGPGNGYRSNALGMGSVAAASRIPPEDSMRGNRIYNSEFRSYNRGGYGNGGHSKQFQPPLPPPREADIFMEAGRMAAEYLISKGQLPPNAISGKWRNDGVKNQVGSFQGFRAHDAEKIELSADSRASVHSRVGNVALDVGPGRRRHSDEFSPMGSRNSVRGRKRSGSFKNSGVEVNRELGRSGSWVDKTRASLAMEADSDAPAGHHDEQSAGKYGGSAKNSSPAETTQEVVSGTDVESGFDKCDLVEDAAGKDSPAGDEKCMPSDAAEPAQKTDDTDKFNDESAVVKEGRNDNNLKTKHDDTKDVASSRMKDGLVINDHLDLVKQCKFVNVPTKARSSLTIKSAKVNEHPLNEDENISKRKLLNGSGVHVIDVDIENSAVNASSHQNFELRSLESDVPASDNTYSTRSRQSLRSGSFHREQQESEELSGFGSSNSMLMESGEKRVIDFNTEGREDFKKLRQWVPSPDAQADNSTPISSSMDNQPIMQKPETSHRTQLTQSSDQNSLFPNDQSDSGEFMEEKQLFPGSFKTCDLNLVGACDVNENHDSDPMLVFPSISRSAKTTTPIDVDLSISNNSNLANRNGKHVVNDKDIEVIDLEKDSAHEEKTFSNPERRGDTVFADLDGFPNNVHNANGISDVQDGYGLMLSEFLGSDISSCSSVPADLNSLHNHMSLPNTEGILGDDDSIYMSLGEIPISLLGSWEQPGQDYGKPF